MFLVQVAGAGLAYLQQVLLARLLGASGYGVYTYIYLYAGFAALLAGLGLPAASVRFLPAYRVKAEAARMRAFASSALRLTCTTAAASVVAALALALVLKETGVLPHPTPLVLGALLVPALALSILYTELARAGERMAVAFVPPQIARPALIALLCLLVAVGGRLSTGAALASTLLAAYAVMGVQHALTRGLFDSSGRTRATPAPERGEWLGVGLSLVAVSAFVIVLMQLDIVIVAAICGSRDGGVYAAASKTAALVSFVIVAINAAGAPRFAALWQAGQIRELQALVRRLASLIFWPSLAISLGIALLAGPLLDLFGQGFSQARLALVVLLLGQVVNAAAGSVGYLLTLTGHHREATVALGLSTIAFLAIATAFTFAFGMLGAAIGSVVGFLLWNAWLCSLVYRRVGVWPAVFRLPGTAAKLAREGAP